MPERGCAGDQRGGHPSLSDQRAANLRSPPRAVWVLAGGQFINAFGNFLPVFLVLYLTTRGVSPANAGLTLACYGAARIVSPVAAAPLADRVPRRVTIGIGMSISAAAVAAIPFAAALHFVMALSAAAGAGAAVTGPAAAALMADIVHASQRVRGFAVQRLAVNIGYATGPAAAGLLVEHGYRWLFVVQPATCAMFAALSVSALPSPARPQLHRHEGRQPQVSARTLRSLAQPRPARLILALTIIHAVYFQTLVTLPLVVTAAGFGARTYGLLASLNGLLVILLELPTSARTGRASRQPTIGAGFVLIGLGISGLGLVRQVPGAVAALVVCVVLYTLGEVIFDPVAQTYVTELAPVDLRGRYQVAFATSVNAGYLLAPILGGAMYVSARVALWPVLLTLSLIAAVLVLWPLTWRRTRTIKRPDCVLDPSPSA